MSAAQPRLGDIALIGDRRTAAAIGRDATVYWYSPHRFDRPSIVCGLLDPAKGMWRVSLPAAVPGRRRYVGDSAVLETQLVADNGELVVTDWMTLGQFSHPGLFCRTFSRSPDDVTISLDGWRDYGRSRALPALVDGVAVFEDGLHLFASHSLTVDESGVHWVLPRGEDGWTVLADAPCDRPHAEDLAAWRTATNGHWCNLAGTMTYDGPYRAEAAASLRQLRLLVFEPTGAIVAAPTVGLPEVLGGRRNYDYRYSWLRDTSMVVRAFLQTARRTTEGDKFLRFIASSHVFARYAPLETVVNVDGRPVPAESNPPLAGYDESSPVRIGNRAGPQLQLDALGNFLLAAALIYRERNTRPHWDIVASVGDFLVTHWQEPDSGIWEAPVRRQYTASKAFAACGLEAVAPFADAARQERYRNAGQAIRRYVLDRCLTRGGAFAAFEGSQGVDVSAALFPVWSFCAAESPEIQATMHVLERHYERHGLFRREDETPQSAFEGAFLPGSFWVAHYWAMRHDRERARRYIEAGLACANDVGLLPEEVSWQTGGALGNLPLGMTHASFLSAIAELASSG